MGVIQHPNDFMMWPYDELTASRGPTSHEFKIQTPWVSLKLKADESNHSRLEALVEKIQNGTLTLDDRHEASWMLRSLLDYPIAYILPRAAPQFTNGDSHQLLDLEYQKISPLIFVEQGVASLFDTTAFNQSYLAKAFSAREWNWDLEASLQFSKVSASTSEFDPYSLLSLARRFSLVESTRLSKTRDLFELVTTLKTDPAKHKNACALVLRQNHYVTQKCNASLQPALELAQRARPAVNEFISSELGHDKLLARALLSLDQDPESTAVADSSAALMEILKLSASRNFLAFALAVDIFERSAYAERDPLATLLDAGGFENAAKQIDVHKGINDSGAHENISLQFLQFMGPVSEAYATEALRFAELVSALVQSVSAEIAEKVREL